MRWPFQFLFLIMCSLLLPYSLKGEVQPKILQFPYYSTKKKWFLAFLKTLSWNCQNVYNLLTPLEAIWKDAFVLFYSVQSVQSLSCVQFFVTPMDCSTPGLPVHHQRPELTQTHVHWVSDAIQPSHPLSSPSTSAFNLSQHQGLFQGVSSSH